MTHAFSRLHTAWSPPIGAAALPSKPVAALNRGAFSGLGLKGLPLKSDVLKNAKTAAAMDDAVESKRKLETLGDMPEIDMNMPDEQVAVGDLEGDDDDDEANKMEEEMKSKVKDVMEVEDDDDVDPLDAFMSSVKEEVKKVNAEDVMKMGVSGRSRIGLDEPGAEDRAEENVSAQPEDELDTTELNPEDILALAAKRARKKDLAATDHARVAYEPFRKEFYATPPEIASMTDEEADLVRLELDSIKIRGLDCPRPVKKWSHFGLPASW